MTGAIATARRVVRCPEREEPAADRVVLDYEQRFIRRKVLVTQAGTRVLVDLPKAQVLEEGDQLVLEDGQRIAVCAADEDLIQVHGRDHAHLLRLAWHLGNRHLPTEICADHLRIRRDHVIEAMLETLGASMRPVRAPFRPEGGAYGHGRTHGHAHGHSHPHGPSHAHGPGHRHDPPHAHD